MSNLDKIDKKYIIERQGRRLALYAGKLDLAHKEGLIGFDTRPVLVTPELAVFIVAAHFQKEPGGSIRTFEAVGDATPKNVGQNVAPHFVRMSETRAKSRALSDALNLGGDDEVEDDAVNIPLDQPRPVSQPHVRAAPPQQTPAPAGSLDGAAASPAQVRAVYQVGDQFLKWNAAKVRDYVVEHYQKAPEGLTSREASEIITNLQKEKQPVP